MPYQNNYKVFKPRASKTPILAAIAFFATVPIIYVLYVQVDALSVFHKKILAAVVVLIGIGVFFALISAFFQSLKVKEKFEDIFARHIGCKYIEKSDRQGSTISIRFDAFEKKRQKLLSKLGFIYDVIIGKGTISGKFEPTQIFYKIQKDFAIYFCGLIGGGGGLFSIKSCCIIEDKKFKFPDFTLKSKSRFSRFISFISGQQKDLFEINSQDTQAMTHFFKSFKLDPKILSKTGNITIDGKGKSLLIICDAWLGNNVGELYGIWNEIYRLFYIKSTGQEAPEEKTVKKSVSKSKPSNQTKEPREVKSMKLEVNTFSETLLDKGIILGFLGLGVETYASFDSGILLGIPFLQKCLIFLCFIGVCYLIRKNIDNYYIIDSERKYLLYHFKLWKFEKNFNFAHFSEIEGVTVSGLNHGWGGRHVEQWWEYRVTIVLASQKIVAICGESERDFRGQCNKAKNIASIMGVKYVEAKPEKIARVKIGEDGKNTFEHQPFSLIDSPVCYVTVVIGFVLFLLVFVFVPVMMIVQGLLE